MDAKIAAKPSDVNLHVVYYTVSVLAVAMTVATATSTMTVVLAAVSMTWRAGSNR